MFPSSNLFLLLLFLLFPQPYPSVASTAHSNIIVDTCKRCRNSSPNVNYNLCVTSLSTVPQSSHTNLRGLAIISVNLVRSNMSNVESKVKDLLEKEAADSRTSSCLKSCIDVFSDSIYHLNGSIGAIKAGRYGDAKTWISAAIDAPTTCEDGFQEFHLESPMTKENKFLFQLSIISLAITSLLP